MAAPDAEAHSALLELYKHFLESIRGMFDKPEFANLTVKCGGRKWDVHKNIVCSRSRYFKGACAPTKKDPGETIIEFPGEDPDDVDAVLHFLYDVEYPYYDLLAAVTDIRVHTIADKYDLPDLTKLAELRFADNLKKAWRFPEFAEMIETVYAGTSDRDGKLTKALLDVTAANIKELNEEDFGVDFRRVIRSNAEFASDVNARVMFHLRDDEVWVSCRACKNEWAQKRGRGECACPECGQVGHSFL